MTIDGLAATSVTVVNDTTVTAVTPSSEAGTVDVTIHTPRGSATLEGGYTYTGPTLTGIAATSGSASGSLGVTLSGTNLTGVTSVTFDGIAATSVNVVSATTVTAVTPAHAAGTVDVAVTTPEGTRTLFDGFTYVASAVGQPAFGGIIAAIEGGLNNLIAAVTDNSSGITWGPEGVLIGASSTTDGAANTAAIVAELTGNRSLPLTSYAAGLCSAYEVDSQGNTPCQAGNACYDDWFLPATQGNVTNGQLPLLYVNRAAIGNFGTGSYVSSTEFSGNPANIVLGLNFVGNFGTSLSKAPLGDQHRVRCVRAFTP